MSEHGSTYWKNKTRRKSSRVVKSLTSSRRFSRSVKAGGGVRTRSRQGKHLSRRTRNDSQVSESQLSLLRSSRKSRRSLSKGSDFKTSRSQVSDQSGNLSLTSNNSGALKKSLQTLFGQDTASVNMSMNGPRSAKGSSRSGITKLVTGLAEVERIFPVERCCVKKGISLSFLKDLIKTVARADFSLFEVKKDVTCEQRKRKDKGFELFDGKIKLRKGAIVRVEQGELDKAKDDKCEVIASSARVNIDFDTVEGLKFHVKQSDLKRLDAMDVTMQHILEEIVWDETSVHNIALVDSLAEKFVSDSFIYVVAPLNSKFSDVLRGLIQLEKDLQPIGKPGKELFFWIDVFCVNFHVSSAAVFFPDLFLTESEEDEERLDSIGKMQGVHETLEQLQLARSVVLYCSSLKSPSFLTSTLAVWQTYCAVKHSKKVRLVLNLQDSNEIKSIVLKDFSKTLSSMSSVNKKNYDEFYKTLKPSMKSYVDSNTMEWAVTDKIKQSFLRYVEKHLLESADTSLKRKEVLKVRMKLAEVYKKDLRSPTESVRHLKACMEVQNKPKEKAQVMVELGSVLKEIGALEEAETVYRELLSLMDSLIGRKQTSTAAVLVSIGETLRERGKYDEAQTFLLEALEIRRAARKKKLKTEDDKEVDKHGGIVECLYNLADCARQEGDFEFARSYCQQGLEIQDNLYADSKLEWKKVRLFTLFASILEATEHFDEAEEYYKKCVSIRKKALGRNHPALAASLCSLGQFLKNRSRTKEAKESYKQALEINEKLYGSQSSQLSPVKAQLALVFQLEGEYEGAEELLLEVIECEVSSENKLLRSEYLNNLANLYKVMEKLDKAEELLKESLSLVKKSLGEKHPRVGLALWNLAVLQKLRGETADAKKSWEKAVEVYINALGFDHPQVQRCSKWWSES